MPGCSRKPNMNRVKLCPAGIGRYLWEHGTGISVTEPPVFRVRKIWNLFLLLSLNNWESRRFCYELQHFVPQHGWASHSTLYLELGFETLRYTGQPFILTKENPIFWSLVPMNIEWSLIALVVHLFVLVFMISKIIASTRLFWFA